MRTNTIGRLPGMALTIWMVGLLLASTQTVHAQDLYDIPGLPSVVRNELRAHQEKRQLAEINDSIDQLQRQQRRQHHWQEFNNQMQHWLLLNELQRQERARRWDAFMQSPAAAYLPAPQAGTPRTTASPAPAPPRYETLEQFTARLEATKAQEKPRACPFWRRSCWED